MKTNIAFASIDNTQTFENKDLNELYVNEGEIAAKESKRAIDIVKQFGGLAYNVFEVHPRGHISFASSFIGKNVLETVTFEEVKNWTDEENGLSPQASFTVKELQAFLFERGFQVLWPDHSVEGTQGVELQYGLWAGLFDRTIIKGTNAGRDEYSGFGNTALRYQLKKDKVDTLLLGGVATDYCVGDTALDAQRNGFKTFIIEEAVRGVAPDTTQVKIDQLTAAGVQFITIDQIKSLFEQKQ